MRLVIVASHPVQYYAPLFRALASHLDVTVYYAHRATAEDQAQAGFGQGFSWDVDLLSGYHHRFLENVARQPTLMRFDGVDTPSLRNELTRERFDAVLVMGWHLKAYIQALVAGKLSRLPVLVRGDSQLVTPRSWIKRSAKAVLYPTFLRQFDGALVVGQRNRAYWAHYKYPQARMFASPHCVDTAWFASRATPSAREEVRTRFGIAMAAPLALFAGKLVSFKRPVDLVHGAAAARRVGVPVEVLVAGAGELSAEMRDAARVAGVPIHMMGFCNQSEMPSVYATADVLVLPSNGAETWGLVANEALASGTPVLLSDAVGCAPDLGKEGVAGRCFPMGDIASLGQALVSVLHARPPAKAIAALSQMHSIEAATGGIVKALDAVTRS